MKIEIVRGGEVVFSKELGEGSYKIGRASECEIQLKSASISKQHALLVIKGNRVAIVDLGSANGIFVNGVLVKKQRIEPDDDVRIVDFQITFPSSFAKPAGRAGAEDFDGNAARDLDYSGDPAEQEPQPETPQEKFLRVMDQKVLVVFYEIVRTCDFRWILASVLLGSLIASVLLSVVPIVRWGRMITTKEALARAHTIVSQTVRENYRILSKTNEVSRLTVEAALAEKGVNYAYIIDPKTKSILAPTKSFNTAITQDREYGIPILLAMQKVVEGKDDLVSVDAEDDEWVVAQPINVYNPDLNENQLSAIAIVIFRVTSEISSIFQPLAEAALFATLFSMLAYFLIYKMVTYPIGRLHEQLDAALKGEKVTITSEAKMHELELLSQTISFSMSRLRQAGGAPGQITVEDSGDEDKAFVRAVAEFDQGSTDGILLLDREKKVCFVGSILEEMVGMRTQYAQGQNISDACRDQGFAGTSIDMCERVVGTLGETQQNMLDINGVARNMVAVGHKNSAGDIRFVLLIVKLGEQVK